MRHKINWQLECGRDSVERKSHALTSPDPHKGETMPKYIAIFTYSSGSWARMVNSPGDRTKALEHMLESVGGSLECLYWALGTHDGYSIFDVPDSVTAEALEKAMEKTGAFKSRTTHELLTQKQLIETLHLARDAAQVYEVPGQPD